jgi:hypothetical protein
MPRVQHLQADIERSQEWVRYCRRALDEFLSYADLADAHMASTHRRLSADISRAQRVVALLQQQIKAALDVEGLEPHEHSDLLITNADFSPASQTPSLKIWTETSCVPS